MKLSRQTFFVAGRLVLGVIFLYAGLLKAGDAASFAGQVAAYQLLPYAFNYLVAATLPYVEIACGALLLFKRHVRPALLLLGGMNLVFIGALMSVVWRGLEIDCGCFDPTGSSGTSAGAALLRDCVLMALIVMTWLSQKTGTQES